MKTKHSERCSFLMFVFKCLHQLWLLINYICQKFEICSIEIARPGAIELITIIIIIIHNEIKFNEYIQYSIQSIIIICTVKFNDFMLIGVFNHHEKGCNRTQKSSDGWAKICDKLLESFIKWLKHIKQSKSRTK